MNVKTSYVIGMSLVLSALTLALILRDRPAAVAQEAVVPVKAATQAVPIFSGKVVTITVYANPVGASSNASSTYKEGRVDFYDRFLILSRPDGERMLVWNDHFSDLRFRSE
jgi:hypothetical protein